MFWLLMRTRRQAAQNTIKEVWRQNPLLGLALGIGGIGLFVLMYAGFRFFLGFAARLGVLSETVYQAFYYLFLLLLAGAVPFVASTLLQSADYNLLFAAPVPPRAVVAARLLDSTVTNSLQFCVLGVPAIVACAATIGIPRVAWLLVPVVIALFVLLPALLTALALLLALLCFGIGRVRSAITLVNVMMGIVVCITFVLETRNLPMKLMSGSASLSAMEPSLTASSRSAHLSPSHWFADVLLGLSTHANPARPLTSLVVITVAVASMFVTCMWLGGRLLSMSNLTEESNSAQLTSSGGMAGPWRRFCALPTGSMIAKDLKFMWRDSMLTSQLSVPLILFAVPFLVALQNHALDPATELYPFAAAIIAFILYMQTSILSLSLLGMESRSFWVVLTSPNTRRSLLLAKWTLSSLVSGGIGMALALVSGIIFRAPLSLLLLQMLLIATSAAALCALGVGLSALFPRFHHDNPAMRVSTGALIAGFFASTGYVLATGTLFGVAYYLTTSDRFPGHERSIWEVSAGAYVLLTVVAIVLPLALGALRIEGYEWEH